MPIHKILYTSQAKHPVSKEECRRILAASRDNNRQNDVTGLLIYLENGTFIQLLEGDAEAVGQTMDRISRDPRHEHIGVITEYNDDRRDFGGWEMAFRAMRPDEMKSELGFHDITDGDYRNAFKNGPAILSVMRNLCLANT
tara:strand:- start:875 stop:1297 length:423 start_codon:yes stop_codon:yes gene_type:complete